MLKDINVFSQKKNTVFGKQLVNQFSQDREQAPFNVVLIETMNTCTRKCVFCKFGQERQDEEIVRMTDECLNHIAGQLAKLNYSGRISPFGINEPLQEPRIIDIIKLFRRCCPQSFISINTNGDLLNPPKFRQLFEAGLNALGISVYDDKGMKRLQRYGTEPNVQILDMRCPPEDMLENRGGEVQQFEFEFQSSIDKPCQRPTNMLVIRPSGDVVICCSDMYGDVVIGNVMEQGLVEIWNTPEFVRYRTQLQQNRRGLKLCETCSHNGSTSAICYPLPTPKQEEKPHFVKRVVSKVKRLSARLNGASTN